MLKRLLLLALATVALGVNLYGNAEEEHDAADSTEVVAEVDQAVAAIEAAETNNPESTNREETEK